MVRPGEVIQIRALKADGQPYRWWPGRVESVESDRIVTVSRAGHAVEGPKGGWESRFDLRAVYWFERPYNLVEVYLADGRLKQIYIHIASPAVLSGRVLTYTDHELDVVWRPGRKPRVLDEGEFCTAATEYGYSPEFQKSCRKAVTAALKLVRRWQPVGPPGLRPRPILRADSHTGNCLQDA